MAQGGVGAAGKGSPATLFPSMGTWMDTAQSQASRCGALQIRWLPARASLEAMSLQVAGSPLSAQMTATQPSRPGAYF